MINAKPDLETVHIIFQNPRGVMKFNPRNEHKRDGVGDDLSLEQLVDINTDILCLSETNVNWKNSWAKNAWIN